VYPELPLRPWLFPATPKEFWSLAEHVRAFIGYATWRLRLTKLDDWYRVSSTHLAHLGAQPLHARLPQILRELYPEHPWDTHRFSLKGEKKSSQFWLYVCVAELFPLCEVVEEHALEEVKFEKRGHSLSLDVYVPALKLALEYQGAHHYADSMIFGLKEMYTGTRVAVAVRLLPVSDCVFIRA